MALPYKKFKTSEDMDSDYILKILNEGQMCIPNDSNNMDWQLYLEWLALGNEPEPAEEE